MAQLLRASRASFLRRSQQSCWTRALSSGEAAAPLGTPYEKLTIGIPKETFPLEKRVAATPESVKRLVKPGFSVAIEDGAGEPSYFSNADYEDAGAKIVSKDQIWSDSDIVMKVSAPIIANVLLSLPRPRYEPSSSFSAPPSYYRRSDRFG